MAEPYLQEATINQRYSDGTVVTKFVTYNQDGNCTGEHEVTGTWEKAEEKTEESKGSEGSE